jgi:ribosome-associated toxin RatA of RatAB toxin-antitoxin module
VSLRTTESVLVPAPPAAVFPHVATLDRYPRWLRLVHAATPTDRADHTDAAWIVELRAQVGPFARSKQLRMVRRVHEPDRRVEFERHEVDGRQHARWALGVEVEAADGDSSLVTMRLAYDGALWTGGLLDRVLDEEIRRGRAGLTDLVSGEPTR